MSNFYKLIFGVNENAEKILDYLRKASANGNGGFHIPRYRNCYISDNKIVIVTRTGGSNRNEYESENKSLQKVEGYINNKDDDLDSTYALFYFEIPEELKKEKEFIEQEMAKDFSMTRNKVEVAGRKMAKNLKTSDDPVEDMMKMFKKAGLQVLVS